VVDACYNIIVTIIDIDNWTFIVLTTHLMQNDIFWPTTGK